MAQTELNRLLILPAIVLAAALSLSGCANLPFFGNDSDSSNSSSSKDDDDEDDEDEDSEDDEEKDDDASGSSHCPQEFLDQAMVDGQTPDTGVDDIKITEIDANEFVPASVGAVLGDGCIFVLSYSQDGTPGAFYEAFVPGGEDVKAELDAALVADGYDGSSGEGFYIGGDNSFVAVYGNDDSGFTDEMIEQQGLGFLGDEFVVVTAYQGQV